MLTQGDDRSARDARAMTLESIWRLTFSRLALYYLIFAAGLALTVTYALHPALTTQSLNGVAFAAVIVSLLGALRVTEGAEIAVTMVLEHDDEQLAAHPVRVDLATVQMLRGHIEEFLTGRQFLVVLMVLTLGLMCLLLESSSAPEPNAKPLPRLLDLVLRREVRDFYAFWFPVIALLVNAQLPSKFAAQQRPMRYFSDTWTQKVIVVSIGIGRILGLGQLAKRFGVGEQRPEPSRLQLYKAVAAFRDGIGFENADMVIVIDPADGSVDFTGRFLMKAYGARAGTKIPEHDFWDAKISNPVFKIEALPPHCGVPSVIGPTLESNDTVVHWDVALAAPLELHEECLFQVQYRVDVGAAKVGINEADFFEYECYKFPVNALSLTVRLKDTKLIALREATIIVDASDEPAVNSREVERVTRNISALEDGYRFEMKFPLIPAKYRFSWEIGSPV